MSMHQVWPDYDAFVAGFPECQFFMPDELLYLGDSHYSPSSACAGKNDYPQRDLWPSIYALALHLDTVRAAFGSAVRLSSVYRAAEYNACVGGVSGSYHKKGRAADCQPLNGDVAGLWKAADMTTPDGGVGRYNSFVHIDIRGTRARW